MGWSRRAMWQEEVQVKVGWSQCHCPLSAESSSNHASTSDAAQQLGSDCDLRRSTTITLRRPVSPLMGQHRRTMDHKTMSENRQHSRGHDTTYHFFVGLTYAAFERCWTGL